MHIIPPFVPKVFIEYPDKVYYYNSLEEYKKHQPFNAYFFNQRNEQYTTGSPYYICRHCNLKHPKVSNFSDKCFIERYITNYEKAKLLKVSPFNSDMLELKYVENKKGHELLPVVRLRNELGDDIALQTTYSKKQKIEDNRQTMYNWWINGSSSPNNRGILQSELDRREAEAEECYGWSYRYRHAIARRQRTSGYRRLRSLNEKKQYYASLVDEHSPNIRGKRSPRMLPDSWNDSWSHYDRSWKNKKITRQYMVNV